MPPPFSSHSRKRLLFPNAQVHLPVRRVSLAPHVRQPLAEGTLAEEGKVWKDVKQILHRRRLFRLQMIDNTAPRIDSRIAQVAG